MKRIAAFLIAFLMLILNIPAKAAGIELYYDGEYHTYTGSIFSLYVNGEKITPPMEPIIFNNRALVPLREVFEALGAQVNYNNDTREITVSGTGTEVKLQIGNNTAYVNGAAKAIPDGVVPKLITKVGVATKTMVPVRFVSESIGLSVDFDDAAGAIKISSSGVPREQIVIKAPDIQKVNDTTTVITINLSREAENVLTPAVTDAGVLYFDLKNAVYEGASKTSVNHGAVIAVRFGLHEGYSRVAVDMQNYSSYNVSLSDDKKTVTITVAAKEGSGTGNQPVTPPDNGNSSINVSTDIKKLMEYTPNNGVKYVVIDAGHGGKDPGTSGSTGGTTYYEKNITLSVAAMVKANLEANGVSVIMTRTGDTYPTLNERADLANRKNAAMFVSIHVNSAENAPNATGIEVYYAGKNNRDYYGVTSKTVADSVLKSLILKTGARNRGVKSENHLVTRESLMPAILVEMGFISNAEEIQKLISTDYQQKIADAISEGIMSQLGNITVPDRKTLAEKLVAEEIGEEKAKEYINEVWK